MKINHFITESADIQKEGERQLLKDPYDGTHRATVTTGLTLTLPQLEAFSKKRGLKFARTEDIPTREEGGRGSYRMSVNAIELNPVPEENDDMIESHQIFAHILEVKITNKGEKQQDPRESIYYISYSSDPNFKSGFNGDDYHPISRVDELPIYSNSTGIGSDSNNWTYDSDNANATKWQDALKPSEFDNLTSPEYSSLENTRASRRIGLGINSNPRDVEAHNKTTTSAIRSQTDSIIKNLQAKPITVSNIVSVVKNSSNPVGKYRGRRTSEYLADLTALFTKPSNAGNIYPLQYTDVGNDSDKLFNELGISAVQSIMTDFMEVIHPVALLTGNCSGNASKIAQSFFGATQEELLSGAVIRYFGATNERLLDSVIYYGGGERGYKKLGVSSKQQGGFAIKPNSPSFTSLYNAYQEVQQIATPMWNKEVMPLLNKNPRFKMSWELIKLRMASGGEEMTPKFINDMASAYGLSDIDANKIMEVVGNSPEFKQLIIWILNHSATVQVDTHANYGDEDTPPVLSNIIATWPTQLASHVSVDISQNKFSLIVNGAPIEFTPVLTDRDDIEYGEVPQDTFDKVKPQGYANANGDVELKTLGRSPSDLKSSPYPDGRPAGTNTVSYGNVQEKRLFAWASEDKTRDEIKSEFEMTDETVATVLSARAAMIGFIENSQYTPEQKMSILKYLPSGNENKDLTKAIEVLISNNTTARKNELARLARYMPEQERKTTWKNVREIGLKEDTDSSNYNFLQKAYARLLNIKTTDRARYAILSQESYRRGPSTIDMFGQSTEPSTPEIKLDRREVEKLVNVELYKLMSAANDGFNAALRPIIQANSYWPRELYQVTNKNLPDIVKALDLTKNLSRWTGPIADKTKRAATKLLSDIYASRQQIDGMKPQLTKQVEAELTQRELAKQKPQRAPLPRDRQRIRGLIQTARGQGRAENYKKAYRDAKDMAELPDEDIVDLLETKSSILRGILSR